MRTWINQVCALFVLLGILITAGAQESPEDPKETNQKPQKQQSWWNRLNPLAGKSEEKKPAEKDEESPMAKPAFSLIQAAAIRQSREQEDYLRRLAVCDRLRAIAAETNDAALRRKADLLDQRAFEVYLHRTSRLTDLVDEKSEVSPK